jgi:hypothetical protein
MGRLSFVGFAIELLIACSHAADEPGFQFSASGSKKIPIIHDRYAEDTEILLQVLLRLDSGG